MTRALEPKDIVDWLVEGEAAASPPRRREGGILHLRLTAAEVCLVDRWLCFLSLWSSIVVIFPKTMVDQLGNKKYIPGRRCIEVVRIGGDGDVIIGVWVLRRQRHCTSMVTTSELQV